MTEDDRRQGERRTYQHNLPVKLCKRHDDFEQVKQDRRKPLRTVRSGQERRIEKGGIMAASLFRSRIEDRRLYRDHRATKVIKNDPELHELYDVWKGSKERGK